VPSKSIALAIHQHAVLVWNTVHIARIVDQLRAAGHKVKDEDLARASPLAHAHVIPNGSYCRWRPGAFARLALAGRGPQTGC
jgi:hypothetical protein